MAVFGRGPGRLLRCVVAVVARTEEVRAKLLRQAAGVESETLLSVARSASVRTADQRLECGGLLTTAPLSGKLGPLEKGGGRWPGTCQEATSRPVRAS